MSTLNQEDNMEDSFENGRDAELPEVPAAVVAAGVVAAAVAVGVIGWMVFRNRRQRPLMQRLQGVPTRLRELPAGLQTRIRRAK
jgi:hypothetical protein